MTFLPGPFPLAEFCLLLLTAGLPADRIIVIKDGEIVEQGIHEELMLLHGEYERRWNKES